MSAQQELENHEKCLPIIAYGVEALYQGKLAVADAAFMAAIVLAQTAPAEQARDLAALAHLHLSLLRRQQKRTEESEQFQRQATTELDRGAGSTAVVLFQRLMAIVLLELGEYRRAIPFFERTIELDRQGEDPLVRAHLLWRFGECHSRIGSKDFAVVPLRAAVKVFRSQVGDPRLPAVLLTLGNALRKSSPKEAEGYYKEAAELYVERGHFESATPAWVNLGVLCSEQGRYSESLEYYGKVLQIRESSPRTPPDRLASVLNNMAGCHRRMKNFAEALTAVDRAIALLEAHGGPTLAAALGTKGLIFRDKGCDAEAVDWLRKAYDAHQKLPSPNLETMIEDLENEQAALNRLGRPEQAAEVERRLSEARTLLKSVPRAEQDLEPIAAADQGAVLVEINFSIGTADRALNRDCVKLGHELGEMVEEQGAGKYAGGITIPESTSLLFYGPDAEALFKLLEPSLRAESLCRGARVTIRQNQRAREVLLPSQVM